MTPECFEKLFNKVLEYFTDSNSVSVPIREVPDHYLRMLGERLAKHFGRIIYAVPTYLPEECMNYRIGEQLPANSVSYDV